MAVAINSSEHTVTWTQYSYCKKIVQKVTNGALGDFCTYLIMYMLEKWVEDAYKYLSATYAINELAKLIAASGSFAKLHCNDMHSYVVKASVKFCTLTH